MLCLSKSNASDEESNMVLPPLTYHGTSRWLWCLLSGAISLQHSSLVYIKWTRRTRGLLPISVKRSEWQKDEQCLCVLFTLCIYLLKSARVNYIQLRGACWTDLEMNSVNGSLRKLAKVTFLLFQRFYFELFCLVSDLDKESFTVILLVEMSY